jgi:predicted DNA-binding transcriptional regulator YafY
LNKEQTFGYNDNIKHQERRDKMDGLLLRSIEENIPLEIIYLSQDQQISQRKLIVKEVNDEYIRAYCMLRKQIRTFRRENILSLMPNTRSNNRFLH